MPDPLTDLADVLAQAAADRDADVRALADLDDEQVDYVARLGELDDPDSDGLEAGCP